MSRYVAGMQVHSLAFRTDLAVLRLGGSRIVDHSDHLSVHTSGNPTFHWGNFILLPQPPAADEVGRWLGCFAERHPEARHVAIGIDRPDGSWDDLAPLTDAGLTAEISAVLTSRSVNPPPHPRHRDHIRALSADDDWEQQLTLTKAVDQQDFDVDFATATTSQQRELVEAGHGTWWGGFQDGALVSSLGLIAVGDGLARFQEVKTHPAARRRGWAGTLVHHAGQDAFARLGTGQLVIVADPADTAIGVYRSVGFEHREIVLQASRGPSQDTAS